MDRSLARRYVREIAESAPPRITARTRTSFSCMCGWETDFQPRARALHQLEVHLRGRH